MLLQVVFIFQKVDFWGLTEQDFNRLV